MKSSTIAAGSQQADRPVLTLTKDEA